MLKLKWKIALSIFILISGVIVGIFLPNYWQTRISMENQLQKHLTQQIELINSKINAEDLLLLQEFPSKTIMSNIHSQLKKDLSMLTLESIFVFDSSGIILLSTGNRENAVKSLMLHGSLIRNNNGMVCTPVYEDGEGEFYSSVFKNIGKKQYLGISASADYFKNLTVLRRQMLIISLIAIAIGLVVALLFSVSLTKPLQMLTQFSGEIGKGRAENLNFSKRKDEIGLLYNSMVEMQEKIKIREKENKRIVASVAHELRNPIAGMQVNLELLMEELEQNDSAYKFAQLTHTDSKKLAEIVDSFLNYSRAIDANLEECEISDLIRDVAQDHPVIINGNATITIHKNKIKHAINNVLRNAFEESDKPVEIEITQNDEVRIDILNFGQPIDVKNKSQIFEAFFSTKENGVGLGLAIAKSIVEQHGGEIILEKSDDSGTLFVITLPRIKNEEKNE